MASLNTGQNMERESLNCLCLHFKVLLQHSLYSKSPGMFLTFVPISNAYLGSIPTNSDAAFLGVEAAL